MVASHRVAHTTRTSEIEMYRYVVFMLYNVDWITRAHLTTYVDSKDVVVSVLTLNKVQLMTQ